MADDRSWSDTALGVGPIITPVRDTELLDVPTAAALAPGVHIGKYELIREIGRGGMGVVYVARDTRLGRRVAMKFLGSATREVAERFLVEARATAQCHHDNIVIIHEADEYLGMPYMVLELLEGSTLRSLIHGPMPPTRAIELMVPVARALARAHESGIVHRDLKPENILVTTAGTVKVLDFGIAKALDVGPVGHGERPRRTAIANLHLTSEGSLVGTLPYMPPEQLANGHVDHRADLWACGIILWELLAGRHPVSPLSSEALYEFLASDDPTPSILTAVPNLPRDLAEAVDACLAKAPDERVALAAQLASMLERQLPSRGSLRISQHESPYPGLVAFQESDADRFFGRTRDIARVVGKLRESPLVAVVGPSGVGKSSFVRAGVVPALKASGERWEVLVIRPGRHPLAVLASLATALVDRRTPLSKKRIGYETSGTAAMLLRLTGEPGYLGTVLRARAREIGGRVLLFVDQLEEMCTLAAPAERATFTAALGGAADDPSSPVRVALAMRSDLLDRLSEDPLFLDQVLGNLAMLAPPDADGLREAIVGPVALTGVRFEEGVVEDMLGEMAGAPGALPLLQFAATKLWDSRDRTTRVLTRASYISIGGVSGALATHADEVIGNMDASSRQLAREVLRRLVTPERTRAVLELADVEPGHQRVIDQLVAARLLVVQTRAEGGGTVELVHESLIDRWPALRRWLDEDHEDAAFAAQLASAAKQWDARGRPPGLLWRGEAMEDAQRWSTTRPRQLPARDRAFLEQVLALGKQRRRLRRIVLVGSFATLVALASAATIALVVVNEARDKAAAALEERKAADDAKVRAEAEKQAAELDKRRAEAEKQRAEDAKRVAESAAATENAQKTAAQGQVAAKEVELEKKAAELEKALAAEKTARESAQRSSADARKAADEANKARAGLAEALSAEKARVKELEEEKRRLSTKLK